MHWILFPFFFSDRHIILRLTFDTALGKGRAVRGGQRESRGWNRVLRRLVSPLPMPTATTVACILCPTKTKVIFIILTGKQITSSQTHTNCEATTKCRQGDRGHTHIFTLPFAVFFDFFFFGPLPLGQFPLPAFSFQLFPPSAFRRALFAAPLANGN